MAQWGVEVNQSATKNNIDYVEKRQFQRVQIDLNGRFMRENRSEFECKVIDMSPGSVAIQSRVQANKGERIICYLDHIGRVEGRVTRRLIDGFAMAINASSRKREKLAGQLTWLANKHELSLPEDRRHERLAPEQQRTVLVLNDGREYECSMIDLSLSGAAVAIEVRPALGTPVTLGAMRGTVVRHFHEGIAIEFAKVQQDQAGGSASTA